MGVFESFVQFAKRSWLLAATIILCFAAIAANKWNFSLTDYIADRVIQKLEANYNPYGPAKDSVPKSNQ